MENKENRAGKKISKIALITYHSAYNFGSVLQAYATQQALRLIGYNTDIINYRMVEQKYFYNRIFSLKYGIRTSVNDLSMLPIYRKRKKRAERFETFFQYNFSLTKEVNEPEEVELLWGNYDLVISGSDQIWNKNSCELRCNDWKYMNPYLLKGYVGRKISYASSINTMSKADLRRISAELESFNALAFRESVSSKMIGEMLHRKVFTVLDPTFLLTKQEWIDKLGLKKNEKYGTYILCYSLGGLKADWQMLHDMRILSRKRKCNVIMVTPFTYIPVIDHHIKYHHEYGPKDFLEALYNADLVVTNSYHGAVLSINFGKDFYSVCRQGASDIRKEDILNRLGLSDRILYRPDELLHKDIKPINYLLVYEKLDILREESLAYLRNNILPLQERHYSYNK